MDEVIIKEISKTFFNIPGKGSNIILNVMLSNTGNFLEHFPELHYIFSDPSKPPHIIELEEKRRREEYFAAARKIETRPKKMNILKALFRLK